MLILKKLKNVPSDNGSHWSNQHDVFCKFSKKVLKFSTKYFKQIIIHTKIQTYQSVEHIIYILFHPYFHVAIKSSTIEQKIMKFKIPKKIMKLKQITNLEKRKTNIKKNS